jgi:addiction module RelE/StbE family toxin
MAQVSWTPQALDDLEVICLFIARDVPQVAAMFADQAVEATDHLANYPRLGRVVPELGIDNIREIILGSYRLIYRIRQDEVQVLTVHHGARLLDTGKILGSV